MLDLCSFWPQHTRVRQIRPLCLDRESSELGDAAVTDVTNLITGIRVIPGIQGWIGDRLAQFVAAHLGERGENLTEAATGTGDERLDRIEN